MNSDRILVLLDMIPQEELVKFFRSNKTQISCMDEPHTFLNQLRDNSLVPEDLYQKVIKMRNKERRQCGVYQILEWLEKQGGQCVKKFWRSVFQDHILTKYSALRSLQTSFLDGSFRVIENLSDAEKLIGSEEKETEQKKGGTKRKKCNDETEAEDTDPSSMPGPSQKRPAMEPTFLESTGSQLQESRSTQSSKDPLDQIKDDACFICNEEGNLVHCTECPRAFHYRCHLPMLQEETLGDSWKCTFCVLKTNQQLQIQMRREDILNSPVSGKIRHCEYLLMCMYKGDELHVFTGNPTTRDAEWSSVISEPMWLDKVKTKLQDNKYRTVGEFVRDINLIFKNCQTLNSDNEFGKMGARLNKIFEREFQTIFKIQ
ncbi:hypothetical protein PGIGA_G00178870 [Pangasianodon gigas]|uniref:Uncharacterized protein n=1 Tax=Pangasianodon gigas TaxID=30993 RepID=A0ACC5XVQ1_PANGG|nr:hypothetical protein [Pangasianodon gigas]